MAEVSQRPLTGVRVVDASRVLAGPWAGQILADLGADVIKIEHPAGDETRRWGPPFISSWEGERGDAAYFLAANRGKRSVVADLSQPRDSELVLSLAAHAHVFIENFKVGSLARYGLDYASVRALNPRLVYCSITGFGQTGPNCHKPGYDFVAQAMAGLMDVTGDPNGEAMKVGVAVGDLATGLFAVAGILAALRHAEITGTGQQVDVALFDSVFGLLANQAQNFLVSGQSPQRIGNEHPNIVPYRSYPTADRPIVVTVGTDRQFVALCEVIGHSDKAQEVRFATNAGRVAHREIVDEFIAAALASRPRAAWLRRFDEAGVPAGPVNSIAEAFLEDQVASRGLLISHWTPAGPVRTIATPIKMSSLGSQDERPPPRLGEHSCEVLAELGWG
jgi:crotonobetainyl-CoA:carnitine CoA-transferase CaiB-like acyl-CoA transferase